jgi:hypothetical protein
MKYLMKNNSSFEDRMLYMLEHELMLDQIDMSSDIVQVEMQLNHTYNVQVLDLVAYKKAMLEMIDINMLIQMDEQQKVYVLIHVPIIHQ